MIYSFDNAELNTDLYSLTREGKTTRLRPKVFHVLTYLLDHRDRVISKDELLAQIWSGEPRGDGTLEGVIRSVRKVIGDNGREQRLIKTLHGHGYQFIANVDIQEIPVARFSFQQPHFIGRERELTLLHEMWRHIRSECGRVVVVQGEPGIGKSRFLSQFCQSLNEPTTAYTGYCHVYGAGIPYLPVRHILQQYCQLSPEDSEIELQAKLVQSLNIFDVNSEEIAPYLLALLGVSPMAGKLAGMRPETRKLHILEALYKWLRNASRQQPMILVVEDIHWIDQSSANWLRSLLIHLDDLPIMVLVSCEPDVLPAWLDDPAVFHLSLPQLNSEQSRRFVENHFALAALPDVVLRALSSQDTWNPFYLQQFDHYVAESVEGSDPISTRLALTDLIAVRISQLSLSARRLLSCLSVLRPCFNFYQLQRLWQAEDNLDSSLQELLDGGFCFTVELCETSVGTYTVSPIWTVYEMTQSLPSHNYRALSVAVLQIFESWPILPHIQCLVTNICQSDRDHDLSVAVSTLLQGAAYALEYACYVETLELLDWCLVLTKELPSVERCDFDLEVHLRRADALNSLGQFLEAETLLQSDDAKLRLQSDAVLKGRYAILYGYVMSNLKAWDQVATYAGQAVEAATQSKEQVLQGKAYRLLAMARYWFEDFEAAAAFSRDAVGLLAATPERYEYGMASLIWGLNAFSLGDFDTAHKAVKTAMVIAEEIEEAHLQAYAAWLQGAIHSSQGKWQEGIEMCQQARTQALDPLSSILATGWLGYAYLEKNETTSAIPHLVEATQKLSQFDLRRLESLFTTFLSESYLVDGRVEQARERAQYSLTLSQHETYHIGMAWANRAFGRIAQASGSHTTAQQYFHNALDIFTTRSACFEAGRTLLSLVELAENGHQPDVARQYLQDAYQRFKITSAPYYQQLVEQKIIQLS